MNFRRLSFIAVIFVLVVPLRLSAASIEIADGSVIIGEIVGQAGELTTIRMKNGAQLEIHTCNIMRIVEGGEEVPLEGADSQLTLSFSGSSTLGEKLIPEMAKAFLANQGIQDLLWSSADKNEKILKVKDAKGCMPRRIEVKTLGSNSAFRALQASEANIAMSSRSIKPEEVNQLAALGDLAGPGSEHVLALDAITIIVHPDNPLQMLSTQQIAAIFAGKITDWAEVGGTPGQINVYVRDKSSGTLDTFNSLVLANRGLVFGALTKRFESHEALVGAVAENPNSIGFVPLPYVRNVKPLTLNECGLLYTPTSFVSKTEEYPLTRRLYLYNPPAFSSPLVREFIRFALSNEGQELIDRMGLVDLTAEPKVAGVAAVNLQLSRMKVWLSMVKNVAILQDLLATTEGAARLSITFRFKPGSAQLDNRAIGDIKRLAAYIKSDKVKDEQLMLLGFTDAHGVYEQNLALSRSRAQSVASQLAWSGIRNVLVKGFGEEAPIACNNNAIGAYKNRRVEVWLAPKKSNDSNKIVSTK